MHAGAVAKQTFRVISAAMLALIATSVATAHTNEALAIAAVGGEGRARRLRVHRTSGASGDYYVERVQKRWKTGESCKDSRNFCRNHGLAMANCGNDIGMLCWDYTAPKPCPQATFGKYYDKDISPSDTVGKSSCNTADCVADESYCVDGRKIDCSTKLDPGQILLHCGPGDSAGERAFTCSQDPDNCGENGAKCFWDPDSCSHTFCETCTGDCATQCHPACNTLTDQGCRSLRECRAQLMAPTQCHSKCKRTIFSSIFDLEPDKQCVPSIDARLCCPQGWNSFGDGSVCRDPLAPSSSKCYTYGNCLPHAENTEFTEECLACPDVCKAAPAVNDALPICAAYEMGATTPIPSTTTSKAIAPAVPGCKLCTAFRCNLTHPILEGCGGNLDKPHAPGTCTACPEDEYQSWGPEPCLRTDEESCTCKRCDAEGTCREQHLKEGSFLVGCGGKSPGTCMKMCPGKVDHYWTPTSPETPERGECRRGCSRRGELDKVTGSCDCDSGYLGAHCQYSNKDTCGGNGVVVVGLDDAAYCVCNSPAIGVGPTCTEHTNANTCNSVGTIRYVQELDEVDADRKSRYSPEALLQRGALICKCLGPETGVGPTCNYTNENTCHNRGVAGADGKCTSCDASYSGPNCQFSDAENCSGEGKVNNLGLCECKGPETGVGPTCEYTNANTCYNRGVASADGNCTSCEAGYAGFNCQFSDAENCSRQGKVDSLGQCYCDNGVYGNRCEWLAKEQCNGHALDVGGIDAAGKCRCKKETLRTGDRCEHCTSNAQRYQGSDKCFKIGSVAECGPGTFYNPSTTRGAPCELCPRGQFASGTAKRVACDPCPPQKAGSQTTRNPGATTADACFLASMRINKAPNKYQNGHCYGLGDFGGVDGDTYMTRLTRVQDCKDFAAYIGGRFVDAESDCVDHPDAKDVCDLYATDATAAEILCNLQQEIRFSRPLSIKASMPKTPLQRFGDVCRATCSAFRSSCAPSSFRANRTCDRNRIAPLGCIMMIPETLDLVTMEGIPRGSTFRFYDSSNAHRYDCERYLPICTPYFCRKHGLIVDPAKLAGDDELEKRSRATDYACKSDQATLLLASDQEFERNMNIYYPVIFAVTVFGIVSSYVGWFFLARGFATATKSATANDLENDSYIRTVVISLLVVLFEDVPQLTILVIFIRIMNTHGLLDQLSIVSVFFSVTSLILGLKDILDDLRFLRRGRQDGERASRSNMCACARFRWLGLAGPWRKIGILRACPGWVHRWAWLGTGMRLFDMQTDWLFFFISLRGAAFEEAYGTVYVPTEGGDYVESQGDNVRSIQDACLAFCAMGTLLTPLDTYAKYIRCRRAAVLADHIQEGHGNDNIPEADSKNIAKSPHRANLSRSQEAAPKRTLIEQNSKSSLALDIVGGDLGGAGDVQHHNNDEDGYLNVGGAETHDELVALPGVSPRKQLRAYQHTPNGQQGTSGGGIDRFKRGGSVYNGFDNHSLGVTEM